MEVSEVLKVFLSALFTRKLRPRPGGAASPWARAGSWRGGGLAWMAVLLSRYAFAWVLPRRGGSRGSVRRPWWRRRGWPWGRLGGRGLVEEVAACVVAGCSLRQSRQRAFAGL
jgi:hypothetical protein